MDRSEALKYEHAIRYNLTNGIHKEACDIAFAALREQESLAEKQATSEWVSVEERLPAEFVSVLGCMTDAGEFPPVRECYLVGGAFFFPALRDRHPVSHWTPLPEPPKEG